METKKYIDTKVIEKLRLIVFRSKLARDMVSFTRAQLIEDNIIPILNQHTREIPEVTQCSNCVFWNKITKKKLRNKNIGICKCPQWSNNECCETHGEDFCSYASERSGAK